MVKDEGGIAVLVDKDHSTGVVELVSDRPDILGKKRFEGSFIVQDEVGRDFHEAVARNGNARIAKISKKI